MKREELYRLLQECGEILFIKVQPKIKVKLSCQDIPTIGCRSHDVIQKNMGDEN